MTFERWVEFVLKYEGEISNDPKDSGGLTKWGIPSRIYPEVKDSGFTRPRAIEIFRTDYWQKCKCDQLPLSIAFVLGDSAVNQGQPTAIRLMQKSLGVNPDGIVGPETMAAAFRASPYLVVPEFIARRAYQYSLHPNVTRFGLGWFRRLAECHQRALEPQ